MKKAPLQRPIIGRNKHNFNQIEADNEISDALTINTIQGDSYTIRELFDRSNSGQDISDQFREAGYEEDATHDSIDPAQFQRMDLFEKQQYIEQLGNQVKNLKQSIEEQILTTPKTPEPPTEGEEK